MNIKDNILEELDKIEEDKFLEIREKLRVIRASKIKHIICTTGLTLITYIALNDFRNDSSFIHSLDLYTSTIITTLSYGFTVDKFSKFSKEENRLVKRLQNK